MLNAQFIEAWIGADIWRLWIAGLGAVIVMFCVSGMPIAAVPGFRGLARNLSRWL
jgi:hypothetical protein